MFLFTVNVFHRVVVRIIVHFFFFSSFSVTVFSSMPGFGVREEEMDSFRVHPGEGVSQSAV